MATSDERDRDCLARGSLRDELEHTHDLKEPRAIADHIERCAQCQRELRLLGAMRERLHGLQKALPSADLSERIFAALDGEPEVQAVAVTSPRAVRPNASDGARTGFSRRWVVAAIAGWVAAAGFLGLFLRQRRESSGLLAGELPPMVEEALREYERVSTEELPVPRSSRELEAALGHRIPYLEHSKLVVVSAWLTKIREEPSAAVAYRFRNGILLQFVVSEALFFRQPTVRDAVVRTGSYFTQAGPHVVLGRASEGVGSLFIAEMSPEVLGSLLPRAG